MGGVALAATLAIVLMIGGHTTKVQNDKQKMHADVASEETISKALQDAKVPVTGLLVRSSGGVVVVRGNGDSAAVQQVLDKLKVQRVANLVIGYSGDDEAIRREAERQLANSRALDGCVLRVSCDKGVLRVSGTVQNDRQIDAARDAVRGVAGVQSVKVDLITRS